MIPKELRQQLRANNFTWDALKMDWRILFDSLPGKNTPEDISITQSFLRSHEHGYRRTLDFEPLSKLTREQYGLFPGSIRSMITDSIDFTGELT